MTKVPDEQWRKSTRSTNTDSCVELNGQGALRDSKNPAGPRLPGAADLVAAVKSGQLDPKQ